MSQHIFNITKSIVHLVKEFESEIAKSASIERTRQSHSKFMKACCKANEAKLALKKSATTVCRSYRYYYRA